MRLLTLAVILLLSSLSFAQHGGSSSPAPSPAPAAAPAPAPAPAASPVPAASSAASSAAASSSASHSSPPSPPSAPPPSASFPSHSAPVMNSSPAASPSRSVDPNSARTAPAAHTPDSNSQRVMPVERISDEGKIVPSARIGEKPDEKLVEKKDGGEKSAAPDFKRPVCHGDDCKEPVKKPEHIVSDLQRPGCLKEPCPCPRGQVAGKGGCTTPAEPVVDTQCSVGFSWSGSSCVASESCPTGQVRRGSACEADCSAANAMAQSMIPQVRSARQERDDACRQDPSGTSCSIEDGRYHSTLGEYQNLWASSPVGCRATLPVPDSL